MKNNSIFLWAGLIVIAFVLIFAAKSGGTKEFVYGVLTPKETFWDFGIISMANGDVSHDFVLENNSDEPIKIIKIQTSCMCTSAKLLSEDGGIKGPFGMHESTPFNVEVKPGENVKLQVIFDPNAHGPAGIGIMDRSVYVNTNSSEKPKLEIKFLANVTK